MNANDKIKELKRDFIREMISFGIKGKLDKTSVIVGACGLILLEMADAYTVVHPFEIPPKRIPRPPRRRRRRRSLIRQAKQEIHRGNLPYTKSA